MPATCTASDELAVTRTTPITDCWGWSGHTHVDVWCRHHRSTRRQLVARHGRPSDITH